MARKKKSIDKKLLDDLVKDLKPDFKELDKITNPIEKAKKFHEIFGKGYNNYIIKVAKLTDSQFQTLEDNLFNEFQKLFLQLQKSAFESAMKGGNLEMENVGLLISKPDMTASDATQDSKMIEKILKKKVNLERMYKLELISRVVQQMTFAKLQLDLKPLTDLEKIVKERFGTDINWCLVVSILATHENIVKKKLTELKIKEDEIEKILKNKKFYGLVDFLGKQIVKKEKRELSLSFYKSPALREMRNKLEHEGYKQPVTNDDVIELIKEIKKFEKELFASKKTRKRKS